MTISSHDRRALVAIALCTMVIAPFIALRQMTAAKSAAAAALDRHVRAVSQGRELLELRARHGRLLHDGESPEGDVLTEIRLQMQAIGLDPENLRTVTAAPAQAIANSPYQRQSVTLTINELDIVDAARLLNQWRQTQAAWSVRSIQFDHSTANYFTMTATIESIHLAPKDGNNS